ncbi:conserved hypothetical protein [delta proteobacterium NaphS2]|nr:conserved hypothetical protein [delta proteobacterium NaphS2]
MTKKRALMDVAKDPLAKKETVVPRKGGDHHGIGHYALTITVGLLAGVIGGLLTNRFLKII